MVRTWNSKCDEKSNLLSLPLSLRDEMTLVGSGLVALELAFEVGILKGDINNNWELANDWESRIIFLFGDAVSISNYAGFVKKLSEKKNHVFSKSYEKGEIFRKALQRFIPVPGHWHFGLIFLVCIDKLYYGGFLQTFQNYFDRRLLHLPIYFQTHFRN